MTEMSPEAELVRKIATSAFRDAMEVWALLDFGAKSERLETRVALDAAGAGRAAILLQKTLLLRILVLVERAFDYPHPTFKDDWNTRVAFHRLADERVFEEVAAIGSRKPLAQAISNWTNLDTGRRREQLRHHRNKVIVHQAGRDPKIGAPLVRDLSGLAMSMVDTWARLAYGTGVAREDSLLTEYPPLEESIAAFWRPWDKRP
jgi:hypothetical protein